MWSCICDCGNKTKCSSASLLGENTKSCGCLQREAIRKLGKSKTTHGKTDTVLYGVWHGMRKRCIGNSPEKNPRYKNRGIKICQEWNDFEAFEKWALEAGYCKGLTIDRIDNNGDYCPENCRLASAKDQARNRSDTIMYTMNGVTKPLIDWSEQFGVSQESARDRLRAGKNPFVALRNRGSK